MCAAVDNKGQLDVIINSTATGFALLSKSGEEVFLGQLRGAITAYDKQTQQVLDVFRVGVYRLYTPQASNSICSVIICSTLTACTGSGGKSPEPVEPPLCLLCCQSIRMLPKYEVHGMGLCTAPS